MLFLFEVNSMMLKKKCSACNEKVSKKFAYCPWCGHSFNKKQTEEDYGMLGANDQVAQDLNQLKLPFGMNTIFNTLMKQLEKDLANMENSSNSQGVPRGFKIQISTGNPKMNAMPQRKAQVKTFGDVNLDDFEKARRANLERVDPKSTVRRLPEGIFYEIETPGVKTLKDVLITQLEESLEIKVYTDDKCYVKNIPMKVEILEYQIKPNKVLLKFKN